MERIFAFHRVVAPLIMEAAFLGFFSLIFFLAASLVPVVGFALSLFTPLPLIFLSLRRGLMGGAIGLLLLFLLFYLSSSLPRTISFLLEFGGMALVLGEGIRRGWRGERAILLAALCAGTGTFLLLIFHGLRSGVSLSDLIDKQITARLHEFRGAFERTGLSPVSWDSLEHFLVQSYPAFLFLGILFAAILNYYLARYIRGLGKPETKKGNIPFSSWSIPEYWVWGFIFALLLFLSVDPWKRVGLNLLLIFGVLYLLQGIAISSSLFERWGLPKLLKVLIYLFLFSQPFFLLLVAGAGLSDVWLNYRKGRVTISSGER